MVNDMERRDHEKLNNRLLQRAEEFVQREGLLPFAGGLVLCAVSGGLDSVTLLHFLKRLSEKQDFFLAAAHYNHCLRGEESEADARFVQQLCARWEIPCVAGDGDVAAYAEEHGVHFAFDLHSPYHKGGTNDHIFIVRNMPEKLPRFDAFSEILQGEITPDAMSYVKENDFPPCTRWNQPGPTFGYTTNSRPECHLAFTLESTYFGTPDNKVSQSRLIALGRCFARAVRKYVASTKLQ